MAGNPNLPTENISDVILRLLKLKAGEELDYQTYLDIIKKRLALHRMMGFKVPAEEDELLRIEFKRISKLKDKGRFKVAERKTKVSQPPPSGSRKSKGSGPNGPKGPNGNGRGPNGPKTTAIIKTPKGKLSTEKFFYEPGVEKVKVKDVTEKTTKVKRDKDCLCLKELQSIDKKLDSIIKTFTEIDKENKKRSERERKDLEEKSRLGKEKSLEARPFEGIKKAISKMLKPFQSVWDIIKNFILNIILGKIVLKLLDWFGDPKNQGKIQSIIRFFSDHWPVLLALYFRFGTGLGRFIGRLGGVLIKGAFRLGKLVAELAIKARIGKAGGRLSKIAGFLGGRRGKALAAGIGIVSDVAVTAGTSYAIDKLAGGGNENKDKQTPTQQFSGGGSVRFPKFAGGGKLNFGNFGNFFSGLVSGQKGVDKIPAMLSDGEFVMSAGAVKKYGVDTLEGMNAAGGGTNKPKIVSGVPYAAGGGLIGKVPTYGPGIANPESFAKRFGGRFGISEMEWKDSFKQFGGVPDIDKIYGKGTWEKIQMGYDIPEVDKLRKLIKNAAFDEASALSRIRGNIRRYPTSQLRSTEPRINPSRMLPAAGESSANAMRAAERAARLVREPIPASRAIVPYGGGGLARTGVTAGLSESIPRITTNMKVPGGRGGGGLVGAVLLSLAEIFKPQIQSAVGELYNKMGIGEGNLSDAELKKQLEEQTKSVQNIQSIPMGSFINSGPEFDRLQFLQQEANKRKIAGLKGGAIKGGYGLKNQAFKDMPKTQIMTDDKGRPFVGYKAMRQGKPVYVRGPQPGERTSNIWEKMGRALNPDAYKQSDAAAAQKKYQEASAGSIESLKARGASQITIARRQAELKKGVKPLPPRPRTRFENPNQGGAKTKSQTMGGGAPKAPSFSANHNKTNTAAKTLGVNKK